MKDDAIRKALAITDETTVYNTNVSGWSLAYTHCSIVAVRGGPVSEKARSVGFAMSIDIGAALEVPRPHVANIAKLRAWCDKYTMRSCDGCDGTGNITERCPHKGCKHTHERECGACNGAKELPRRIGIGNDVAGVSIRGENVDVMRLAPLLALFDGDVTYGGADLLGTRVLTLGKADVVAVLAGVAEGTKIVGRWGKR